MKCFCNDLTASATAKILSTNRNIINAYFKELRIKISDDSIKKYNKGSLVFELDESYLDARKVNGKNQRSSWESPCFLFVEEKWKGIYNNRAELTQRVFDAYNSREDPRGINNSNRWLECL